MPVFVRRYPNAAVGLFYAVVASLLLLPDSSTTLLADDFQVVYRVATSGQLLPEGFFRPLSDFTFLINYWVGGFHPAVYIGFNLLLHLAASYSLYRFSELTAPFWGITHPFFPVATGLLFLVYPYHTEPLSWAVGRGASLAVWLGLWALNVAIGSRPTGSRMGMVALLYFTGMAGYETLLALPLLLLVLLHALDKDLSQRKQWMAVMGLSLALHLAARFLYSKAVLGGYGETGLSQSPSEYLGNLGRILARLVVPPMESGKDFVIAAAAAALVLLVATFRYLKWLGWPLRWKSQPVTLGLLMGLTLLVPVTFSVSTHTSESDRLLYFPSVWCCLFGSILVFSLQRRQWVLIVIAGVILPGWCAVTLRSGLRNWHKASALVTAVLDATQKDQAAGRNTVWLNLPGEYQGAFVFRHGFEEALLIHRLDISRVRYLNIVNEKDYPGGVFVPTRREGQWRIPPHHWVARENGNWVVGSEADTVRLLLDPQITSLRYWDKKELQVLALE